MVFEKVAGEPWFYFLEAIREGGGQESEEWSGEDTEPGVVHTALNFDLKFMEGIIKGKQINDEYKGPEYKTLGNTGSDRKRLRFSNFESDEVSREREM